MTDGRDDEEKPLPPAPDQPARPVQRTPPKDWPAGSAGDAVRGPVARPQTPAATPLPPLGERPMPDLRPLGAPPLPPRQPPAPPPPPGAPRAAAPAAKAARRRVPWWRRIVVGLFQLVGLFVLLSVLWVAAYRIIPPPVTLTMVGDVFAGHGMTKYWVPIDRIDPDMPRAAMAGEDARFCSHHGFDFEAMEAAWKRNQRGGRIRGGSTISQQTAKNVFLWQGGGYFRKAMEAWFTLLIENIWGKRRIMEVYLNVAETGIGTYGVEAGARRYFKHGADRMSVREAAQIAAVLPLPKKRAGIDPQGFTRRYGNRILANMNTIRVDGLDACLR